jgi:hypothetical protein
MQRFDVCQEPLTRREMRIRKALLVILDEFCIAMPVARASNCSALVNKSPRSACPIDELAAAVKFYRSEIFKLEVKQKNNQPGRFLVVNSLSFSTSSTGSSSEIYMKSTKSREFRCGNSIKHS